MRPTANELLEIWGGATAILSPRDMKESQLLRTASDTIKRSGTVLIDPQLYTPSSDHFRLSNHTYWPKGEGTNALISSESTRTLLGELVALNESAGAERIILPGFLTGNIGEVWERTTDNILNMWSSLNSRLEGISSICLDNTVMASKPQIEKLLNLVSEWPTDHIYLVMEHPQNQYQVDSRVWLANALFLMGSLALQEKEVILAFSNQQMIVAHAVGVSTICSGHDKNLRTFSVERFQDPSEESIRRSAIWYYCPQSMTEYKLDSLSMAQRSGLLASMSPDSGDDRFCAMLFSGMDPSASAFTKSLSQKHYLHSLYLQCLDAPRGGFDERLTWVRSVLNAASERAKMYRSIGADGGDRDILSHVESSLAALNSLETELGLQLRASTQLN